MTPHLCGVILIIMPNLLGYSTEGWAEGIEKGKAERLPRV